MHLAFRKYHGLGNDFIVFDGIGDELPTGRLTQPELAIALCDRNTGIGADGFLLILPPESSASQAQMRIINADGSEPEMCGNGIRCVAKALHDRLGFTQHESLTIDTGAGPLSCHLQLGEDGLVASVKVDMGKPQLERSTLPMIGEGQCIEQPLSGNSLSWTAVSMGNPHIVSFIEDPAQDLEQLARTLGPEMERHSDFPRRTNVEFVRLEGGHAQTWVWERGCGITQACGTGACAVAVAATVTGRHQEGPLSVQLPGGTLQITVEPEIKRVWMNGPAVEVFHGNIAL